MPVNSLMTEDTVNNSETLMGILEKNITKTILYMKRLYMKSLTIKERKKIIISITCLGIGELQFLQLTYLRGKGRAGKQVTEGQREALFSRHILRHLWIFS